VTILGFKKNIRMIIYNVTVKVDLDVKDEWLDWMRKNHIPKVLSTGIFNKCRISKLDIQESDGASYAIQYECFTEELLQKYMIHFAPALQKEHMERYAGRFVAIRTILQVVEEIFPSQN